MARGGSFRTSICLVILFILGGSISFGILPLLSDAGQELPETSDGLLSQEGDSVVVDFPSAGASSSQLKLEIPHDQTLQTLGMTVSPHHKAREMAFTLDDWDHPDAINYDLSVEDGYLSVPKASSIEFDFESTDHGWNLASGGGWKVGHDSSLGLPGGVNSGSNALYSFDGNYPNSLGTTYWATSPPIECGECTGSWSLNYYRRLGVESSTWDHAYVQVRSVSGSWVQIYHNPSSTVNEQQFTFQSHVVSSYVNGNDNFQVRFGIGSSDTIVQYTGWNVDDLSITCTTVCGGEIFPVDPGLGTLVYPNGSWTSPSFGYANGASYQWSEGPYASMNVDFAANPDAQWNWTVVNGTSFEPIEGHVNQTGEFIDLSSIDWEKYPSLRLKIEMAGNASGFGPQIRAINGGGALNDAFLTEPSPSNWILNGTEFISVDEVISGNVSSTLSSSWLSPGLPFYAIEINGVINGNITLEVMTEQGIWENLILSQKHEFNQICYNAKLRITGQSVYWNISEISVEFVFTELPYAPFIDVGWDQEKEWSFEHPSIGTWGWQDRFWDGNFSHQTTLTNNGQAVIDVWIPKQDIHHFQVTATDLDSAGGLEGLNVLIGSQAIVSRDFSSTSKYQLHMDEQERATLSDELANRPAIFNREGQSFVFAKVEIIADPGRYLINGLGIGYHAQSEIDYGAMDWFVKTINSQRLTFPSSGMHEIPIYLQSESSSALHIEINKMTYDDTASIVNSAVVNNSQTLTPSHKWRTFEASYALQESTPNAVILDLRSDDASAQWILPISGNQVIGTGDSDVLIFHENPVEITGGQNTKQVSVHWRTSQHWDDQSEITIEMRLSLLDGFVTMPSRFSWGDQSHQASDNDIEIRSITWSNSDGLLSNSHTFLKNGETLLIQADIGFQNAESDEYPYQDEFELILTRRGTQLVNVSDVGGALWNFTDLVPLVAGEIEWNLSIEPTAGAGYGDVTSINRTFVVDSLAAQVVGCSIQKYDHKTASIFQRVEVNVTDRPVLPSDLSLMLWMEWVDDDNNDAMPSEGEYQKIPLSSPANLDQPFGIYTATFSDVGGFDGQKVVGYVTGTDQAGIPIKNGGDSTEGNHLFMYQLMPDLSPVVLDDAMSWDKEITHWLHPGQSYTLYANFSEANGASDVETIELQLASNIASDRMSLFWHDSSNQCSSSSHHIEILSCSLLSGSVLADPFDKDLSLEIHLQLAWTTPELGELRREPALHVTDDGGQSSQINLPYLRWRFSPEMMIKDDVSLWIENGEETQDGARVAKNSILQLQGSLVFAQSDEIPDFNCEISTLINAKYQSFDAENGLFFAQVEAPSINGNYPLSWSIGCLPEQGRDVTDLQKSVFWIGVDADGPIPVEILSPRPNSNLHHDIYPIQVMISEDFGIDVDSVMLHWWVTVTETDEQLAAGESPMQVNQTNQMGQRMQFDGVLDLNEVDEIWMQEELLCNIYLTGRDMAGNSFEVAPNNSRNQPFHSWQMHHVQPEFVLTQNAVSLSKLQISVDETSAVQIDVQNIGSLEGEAEVTIEIMKLDGTTELLRRTNVQVNAVSRETLVVDWKPTNSGLQWVKVTIDNQQAESAKVDVKELEPEGFMDGVFQQANPALLGFSIVGASLLGLLCLMWLRLVTYTRGYGDEAEYYDEEDFIDDDDDFDDEEEV